MDQMGFKSAKYFVGGGFVVPKYHHYHQLGREISFNLEAASQVNQAAWKKKGFLFPKGPTFPPVDIVFLKV